MAKKTKKELWHEVNGPGIPTCRICQRSVKWDATKGNYRNYCSHKCYITKSIR